MAFKILLFVSFVALTSAGLYDHGYHGHGYGDHHQDYHAPAHYSYKYGVEDPHTGDVKAQHETRDGDVVKGYYTLNEADGTKRIVHYTSDHHSGFNAHVERVGHASHPAGHHYGHGYGYDGHSGHYGGAHSYASQTQHHGHQAHHY